MRSGGSSKKDRCLPTWLTLNETNSIARPQQTEKMCSLREGRHVDSLFKCSIFGGNGVRGREGKGNPSYIYNWQSIITDLPLAQYLPHLPENCSPRISVLGSSVFTCVNVQILIQVYAKFSYAAQLILRHFWRINKIQRSFYEYTDQWRGELSLPSLTKIC